jgi:hypothetical protein
MPELTCHCGAVRITVDTPPAEVTDCNCSICRRYGVLWAYYVRQQVHVPFLSATDTYRWGRKAIDFHRCKTCGCITHWTLVDTTRDRMGVNARLFEPAVLAQARLRHLDAASM